MNRKLEELKTEIFFGEHTDSEWEYLKKKVDKELSCASEGEKKEFIDCGAGPLLEQVLEYIN